MQLLDADDKIRNEKSDDDMFKVHKSNFVRAHTSEPLFDGVEGRAAM